MNGSKISLCCVIWFLFFYSIGFGNSSLHATKVNDGRWSFAFKNCTISDALEKMTKVTGIDIFTNKNRDKSLFNKSYKDQTIDQILKDLFRKKNSAMVWSYGDNGLEVIGVWIFEGSGSGGSLSPKRFTKQRGRNLRSNRIKKDVDHKPRVVRRQSQKTKGNKLFSHQSKSKDYMKESKESIGSQYSKVSTGRSQSKSDSFGHTISDQGGGEVTPALPSPTAEAPHSGTNELGDGIAQEENQASGAVTPPPAPEKMNGLEPPPMPPGFSY